MRRERQISKDLLVEEFLDAIQQRADADFKGSSARAFVAWYVDAEFGRVKWHFTDDAGDGGVDAVVECPGEWPPVVVIQSKFSGRVGKALLDAAAYREFDRVVDAFHAREEGFTEFLESVREDARRAYRRAYHLLSDVNLWTVEKRAFRLITTRNRRKTLEHSRLPESAYRYGEGILELYRQYRKGHTPRAADLTLGVDSKLPYKDPKRRVTSYLFNARLSDFRAYFEHYDVDRLVARNIRYNLAGKIGRAIRKTYEETPHNFWYVHNGLTIICDSFREHRHTAVLTNPSVVNGAQTLYAISSASRQKSDAFVCVRVVVRGPHGGGEHEDDEWVQGVIRGVNTQNRVRNQDFRSNEPEQMELQRLFRDQGVFYERKRGEFREYRNAPLAKRLERASMRSVGMALTAVSEDDGSGVVLVKRGVDAIFEVDNYRKLFPNRRLVGRRFESIYLAYRVMSFVRESAFRGGGLRKYRHAFWTAVWLAYRGLSDNPRFFSRANVASIREGFEQIEGRTLVGMQARAEMKRLRNDLWKAWRKASRRDRDQWTPVNFFKSKLAHKRLLSSVYPQHRRRLRLIGQELQA